MVDSGRQLPARTTATGIADGVDNADRRSADAISSSRADLVWTKLWPPAPRAGLIPRTGLQSLLQAGLEAKLCLLGAPAGFGKTTLLVQWRAAAGAGRVAWVSLDEEDNDPTRFWVYVLEALRTVEPEVGTAALQALQGASTDLDRVVLPLLLNDLTAVDSPLVLVLDDYHLIANLTCHQSLGFFLEHLPAGVHVALATRVDPPLQLARMRARGELAEFRAADLQFTDQEASALLNGSMGLQLGTKDVQRLAERTEGWAAGLVLAGLSLHGRDDPSGFVASFHGDHRHVTDYLGAEVLGRQSEEIRTFLLRTSVLERLSGPLCDAVLEIQGSAALLVELERSNLFLLSLDDHREWYRYHQLFADLLRLELAAGEPGLLPVLHRRAAAWYRAAGDVDQAIHHATVVGDYAQAAGLVAQHWLGRWRQGQGATVARWLDGLPEEAIVGNPLVAYVAAWVRGCSGASKQQTQGWLAAADDDGYEGALPDGVSLAFAAALTRASLPFDDVGDSVRAARRALELADPAPAPSWWMASAALGQALYLAGESAETRPQLEELVRRVSAATQPYAVVIALGVLSLTMGDRTDGGAAMALARRGAATAEAQGLSAAPLCAIAYLALGRALTRQGELAEAGEQLDRALELVDIDSMALHHAHALLLLASVRRGRGDLPGARALVEQARELIEQSTDPGVLPAILQQTRRALDTAPHRPITVTAPLTERELAVLRLLPGQLSTREIGRELYVSVHTIRSQVQAVYRKLHASNRAEAIARARQLGLLPGTTTDP
jgi:LuxR family maltose regulon positive regulatory protein